MSAFENFIQVELPKRPYTTADSAQESVLIRRGPGPRQHEGVTLADGQVLGKAGGIIQGITPASLRSFKHIASAPAEVWTVAHNLNSEEVIIQVFDEAKFVIIPDAIQIFDQNTIVVSFSAPQAGVARVVFLD